MGDFFCFYHFIFVETNLKNMKIQAVKKMMYVFMATVVFISCSKEESEIEVRHYDPIKDKAIGEAIALSNDKGIPFPEGSKVFKEDDGMFTIVLPENMYYLIANDLHSKQLSKVAEIKVHCTCSVGYGCSVLKKDEAYYCVMEPSCKTCDRRVYSNSKSVVIKGMINVKEELSLIRTSDKKEYKCMKSEVLNLSEVKEGITRFYQKMHNGNIPDFIKQNKEISSNKFVYVKTNVFGYVMLLPVLRSAIMSQNSKDIEIISKITCGCDWGTGCVKKRAFGGIYCESGPDCASCVMYDK